MTEEGPWQSYIGGQEGFPSLIAVWTPYGPRGAAVNAAIRLMVMGVRPRP